MSTWRVAKSLEVLLGQVNQKWPNRSKASDGSIGDANHSARTSDHNPNGHGVVCARDFTNDPSHGLVSRQLAQGLISDRRVQYVISNRQICTGLHANGPAPGVWRPYTGANPHEHHCHVSVSQDPSVYDSTSSWDLSTVGTDKQGTTPPAVGSALWLQQQLNKHAGTKLQEDGHEGDQTKAATRAFAVEQLKGLK